KPQRVRLRDFGNRVDAAVESDENARALLGQQLDRLRVEPVPFADAVRDVRRNISAQLAKKEREKRGRANAVDIVIAVERNPLPLFECFTNPLDRLLKPLHQERIGEIREAIGEKSAGRFRRRITPMDEDASGQRMKGKGRSERSYIQLRSPGQHPAQVCEPLSRVLASFHSRNTASLRPSLTSLATGEIAGFRPRGIPRSWLQCATDLCSARSRDFALSRRDWPRPRAGRFSRAGSGCSRLTLAT